MFLRIKKSWIIVLCFMSLINLYGQNNISIKGKFNNYNNEEKFIYFRDLGNKAAKPDTIIISEKGEFTIDRNIKEINYFQLGLGREDKLLMILAPGEKINVELDVKNISTPLKLTGSDKSELIYKVNKEILAYDLQLDSLNKVYKNFHNTDKQDSIGGILLGQYREIENLQKSYIRQIITENNKSLVCLVFINRLDINKDFEIYKEYDKKIYKRYPNNIFVKDFHGKVEIESKTAVGEIAPEINLFNPEGEKVSLSSLRGKIVLIDFWAAWCSPCRRESPNMVKIYKKFKDSGFEIYGVSLDKTKDSWMNAIKIDGLIWTHVTDLKYWKSEAALAYGVKSIPYTVLIDRDGVIIAKGLRGESLEKKLEEIFE